MRAAASSRAIASSTASASVIVTNPPKKALSQAIKVETFDGKVFVEWDPDAAVTPLGQLPFFIEFLKTGHLFTPWVNDCP